MMTDLRSTELTQACSSY